MEDVATQKVFRDYKEKLRTWINPILRRQRKVGNLNPKMSYKLWRGLMDGPGGGGATDGETAERNKAEEGSAAARGKKADCPKMIGEWQVKQESEITGDERVGKFVQMTFHAKLSMAQVGWNFLRSQSIEQLSGGDVEGDTDDIATLDFNELQECIARCAADMYRQPIETYVPSLKRNAMTLATATQSFCRRTCCRRACPRSACGRRPSSAPSASTPRMRSRAPTSGRASSSCGRACGSRYR